MNQVVEALSRYRFRHQNEEELQLAIAQALTKAGLPFQREVVLGPRDRIDFLSSRTGIEVKIKGSSSAALQQLYRYAKYQEIDELVLVTSRVQAGRMPSDLLGKPIHVVFIFGGLM